MFIALKDKDLAYLTEKRPEFEAYIKDLHWAQEFARLNREEMMDRVLTELSYTFFKENGHQKEIELERINCHHNFTQQENHMGHNVWITRRKKNPSSQKRKTRNHNQREEGISSEKFNTIQSLNLF